MQCGDNVAVSSPMLIVESLCPRPGKDTGTIGRDMEDRAGERYHLHA
jgi:hypothetical protein